MKQIGFRIDDEFLAWLLKKAKKENRTVNNYIHTVLLKEKEKDIREEQHENK